MDGGSRSVVDEQTSLGAQQSCIHASGTPGEALATLNMYT